MDVTEATPSPSLTGVHCANNEDTLKRNIKSSRDFFIASPFYLNGIYLNNFPCASLHSTRQIRGQEWAPIKFNNGKKECSSKSKSPAIVRHEINSLFSNL